MSYLYYNERETMEMGKMLLVFTRAGILYECPECHQRLTPDEADNHECMAVFSL